MATWGFPVRTKMPATSATSWSVRDDDELFSVIREKLFPAIVGDVMDVMGCFHQFLPQQIQPLREDMVVLGRAMPVLQQDFEDEDSALEASKASKPFGLMLDAL